MTDYSQMSDEELARIAGIKLPAMPADQSKALAQQVFPTQEVPDKPDYSKMSDAELMKIAGIGQQAPAAAQKETGPSLTDYAKDVAKSAIYRGIPEGIASVTPLGYSANIIRGVSDLTRWAAHKGYKAATGETLPYANENPVPTSHDILQAALQPKGLNGGGIDLYEPKTTPGQYANTVAQFASGGAVTGVPLAQSIPAAMASEAAGQAVQGSEYEPAVRIGAAILGGGVAGSIRDKINAPKTPTSSEVRAAASQKYQQSEQQGGAIAQAETNAFLDSANQHLPTSSKVRAAVGETASSKLIDGLESNFRNSPLSLREAQDLDSHIGDLMMKEVDPKTGILNADGKRLMEVQQSLRKTVEGSGAAGTDALSQGRQLWAAQARMNDVERILNNAETAENPITAIKTGFRTMLRNPSRMRGFTDAEKAAIEKAARTGLTTGALKIMGSRLMSGTTGAIAGASGGGPIGGILGFVGGEMAGYPMRAAANALQRGRANNVLDAIASRPAVQNAMGIVPQQSSNALLIQQLMNKQINLPGLLSNGYVGTNNPTGLLTPRP